MLIDGNGNPIDVGSSLYGKKAVILGDSLTEQSAGFNPAADSAGLHDGIKTGYGFMSRISRAHSLTYKARGIGNQEWGISAQYAEGGVDAVNRLVGSSFVPDYIILEYGTNNIWHNRMTGSYSDVADGSVGSSMIASIRYCVETCQANFPRAKLLVIMPTLRAENLLAAQKQYVEIVDPVFDDYGVKRCRMGQEAGIVKAMMQPDGIHLRNIVDGVYTNDSVAVEKYSRAIESALLNL